MFGHHCTSLFHLFCSFSPISCQHQSSCVIKVGNFHGVLLMTWLHLLHRPYAYRCEAVQLLLDLIRNSEGTKLLILTVIFCLVFTAPAKWRVELRAKIGHYRNRCLTIVNFTQPHHFIFFYLSETFMLVITVTMIQEKG